MDKPSIDMMGLEELRDYTAILEQELGEVTAKLDWCMEQLHLARHQRFAASTEQTDQLNFSVFDEATIDLEPVPAEPGKETIAYERKKRRGRRDIVLQDLPVERIEHHLPEEELIHGCGGPLHVVSTTERRKLHIIPAQAKIIVDVYFTYACRRCEHEGISSPMVTVPMPVSAFPNSLASPSVVAYILDQKYVQGMPLYRQEKQFSRFGIELSRQTLANWVIQAADIWLSGIYDRMHELLLQRDILHADEPSLQVLHEPGRSAQTDSFIWLYRTGREAPHIILYEYQPTRSRKHPLNFLAEFKGYLHVDGYPGYDGLPNVTLVGCWSHSRRKFVDALKALPKGKPTAPVAANKGLSSVIASSRLSTN